MNEDIPQQPGQPQQPPPEQPYLSPMSSPANDVRKLKASGAATADELNQWLAKMRGKSPKEVLGLVASSSLVKSFVLATFLAAILIFTWTAGAWGYENFVKNSPATEAETEATETASTEQNETANEQPEPAPANTNIADPNKAEMPDLDVNSKQKVADKLGIGETKDAPANVNPLDDTDDDLLKGLE